MCDRGNNAQKTRQPYYMPETLQRKSFYQELYFNNTAESTGDGLLG